MGIDLVRRTRTWAAMLPLLALRQAGCAHAPHPAPIVLDPAAGCTSSTSTGRWRIGSDGTLRGTVTGIEGRPLREALVTINLPGNEGAPDLRVQAGEGGAFRLENQSAGRYWVRVRHVGHGIYSDTVEFVRQPGEGPRVSLCYSPLNQGSAAGERLFGGSWRR
jgi:hypothetical protein